MSYIRPLSNPESLYVWVEKDGVHIIHRVMPPLASKWPKSKTPPEIRVPQHIFHRVCRQWEDDSDEHASYRGLVVKEVRVDAETGEPLSEHEDADGSWLIRLSYKRQFFFMWRVTWEHVVRNANARDL